ncbi:MAG: pca operon transcription factor PcaQ [Paracoccus sp. (in: a-proteobacteria)]|uniref:pca operon transcription factor PcaQ n=1 Tax=Paracoccus sp. TaxID=267 RepID=UPI0026E0E8CE|nr:pca operon transcription factor PcaQ [Paracoccus sp. (in: a-proteobacteria)]MDO5612691.1 pca operon transcription factor PcaQ [Paracoccus sp. (in: a-proteobacteria)]
MDRRIKLRHIQAFVEIVRQRSLKRAAERLLLTQPAISRTLAELEQITGGTLLTRSRSGIALTPEGEFFHRFAVSGMTALEQGLAGLNDPAQTGARALRVGALPSVAALLMPQIAGRLADAAPDLRLSIIDGQHGALTAQLRAGDLAAVIGRLGEPDTMRGLTFTQLYLEEVAIVTRPGHPIATDTDLRRVGDWPVIFPPPVAAIRPLVERLLIAEGLPLPPNRIESVSGAFGRAQTRASDAIWFISAGVVAADVAEGRLTRLPIDTGLTRGPVGLMQRADDPAGPELTLFRRAALDAVAGLGLS